jgi:hypothetical protein
MTRLPELIQDLRASQNTSHVAELDELTRTVPKLIGLLPALVRDQGDVRQNVAVANMISGLTRQLDYALPLALVSWTSPRKGPTLNFLLKHTPEPQTASRPTSR